MAIPSIINISRTYFFYSIWRFFLFFPCRRSSDDEIIYPRAPAGAFQVWPSWRRPAEVAIGLYPWEGKVPVGRPIGQLKESHMFGVWWIVFTVCWTPIKLLHVVCVIGVKQSHKVKESPSYQSLCYWNSYISNAYLMDCLILQVWNLLKHDVTWWGQRSVMMHEGNVQMKSIIWFPQHTNFTNSTIDRCLD